MIVLLLVMQGEDIIEWQVLNVYILVCGMSEEDIILEHTNANCHFCTL